MANRGVSYDAKVHTIADLRELGSRKLPVMYRGEYFVSAQRFRMRFNSLQDYFNEGAMDLIT